jgi:multidrug efflux pump subunit AcrA (membrane-fusion protein)
VRRRTWALTAATVLVVASGTGGMVAVTSGKGGAASAAQEPLPDTATVERGKLSDVVSLDGTLTHRARLDGSPYAAINQAVGTYTRLPEVGDRIGCGDVLYRVDDKPVLLLCGAVPTYRALSIGAVGQDVRQLNRNLHRLGYDVAARAHLDPRSRVFTGRTEAALEELEGDRGLDVTGAFGVDAAVFLPEAVRIAKVTAELGGVARPGGQVLQATSDTLEVQASLDPSQQGEVRKGDRARITLPGNKSVTGRVVGFGRVAEAPAGQDRSAANATIPAQISLDQPQQARGLDQAPVEVDVNTVGVDNALSVPVTAIVGKSGGGYAVEAVHDDGRRQLVAVRLGLFDTTAGRVQVGGDIHEGDHVVVPSS